MSADLLLSITPVAASTVRTILEIAAAGLALCGISYNALCMVAARAFLRAKGRATDFLPPVSILKPVHGADPHAYDCFRSHCLQDYPAHEVIFGVSHPADPAVAVVERLVREFPRLRIQLLVCSKVMGANRKVSTLVQMLPSARYNHLLVNDGDIRVPPDYLRRVVAPLADERVGLVTALYRGVAGRSLWSGLESLGIADFAAGVLLACHFDPGFHYGLGSTLCFSRATLIKAGGFERLLEALADDYHLATNIAAAGYRVAVCDVVVETMLPDYSFRDFWSHQMRWARTVRDINPAGYFGLVLTFAVGWAALAVIVSGGTAWSWWLLALAAASRLLMTIQVGNSVLKNDRSMARLWLLPLRLVLEIVLWAASFFSNTVVWRGERFALRRGKLMPIAKPAPAPTAAEKSSD